MFQEPGHPESEVAHEVTTQEAVGQTQTLHDFVLNLLRDDTARAAFAQDPTQLLGNAGLGDITAQDVEEVIPLVMDYGQGALPLESALGTFPATAAGQEGTTGLEGAIQQLQGVARVAGEHRFDLSEGGAATTDFSSDYGHIITSNAAEADGVSSWTSWDSEPAAGEVRGSLDTGGAAFGAEFDSFAGEGTIHGRGGLHGVDGGAAVEGDLARGSGAVDASIDGVTGDVALDTDRAGFGSFGVADTDGAATGAELNSDMLSATGGAAGSLDGYAFGGSLDAPSGTYGIEVTGDSWASFPEVQTTGDLADALDTETLGRGDETAASAVATYVTSDGAALGSVAPVDRMDLPELPAETVAPPADALGAQSADTAEGPVEQPADVAEVSAAESLPTDVSGNASPDLPLDLPVNLPADLPVDLPIANPLPILQDLRDSQPVGETLGEDPLDGITNAAEHLPLPETPGLGDLDLGH